MAETMIGDVTEATEGDVSSQIPSMMFAEGEEPVGVRVLTYQSSRAINTILNALEPDEIQFLRDSSFGKMIDIADKPSFSGRFARFLLSRQLKIEKKHEAWFRFAGQPIRFSLREFAIVTGLPCGELPLKTTSKKKKNLSEKPYWPDLFGTVEELSVSRAVKMLRRKTVTDKSNRIKLAALAIVSSVLLSTNLKMKMLKEHAQMLSDIDEFFSFPWGRLAFDLLMESIKKRDEVSLSQNTIALKGFALALQLVIVEAVPALTEVVQEVVSSSESDSDDDDPDSLTNKTRKQTLSPAHAREVDKRAEAIVKSIIPQDPLRPVDESLLVRNDEVCDPKVEKLVMLINENFVFSKSMFRGGATQKDVEAMRLKAKLPTKRSTKTRNETSTGMIDFATLKATVASLIKPDIDRIDTKVSAALSTIEEVSKVSAHIPSSVVATVEAMLKTFREEFSPSAPKTNVQNSSHSMPNNHDGEHSDQHTPPRLNTSGVGDSATKAANTGEQNNDIINNIIENISEYSTPPENASKCPTSDGRSRRQLSTNSQPIRVAASHQHQTALSGNSQTDGLPHITAPSFSLGFTQEEQLRDTGSEGLAGDDGTGHSSEAEDETQPCRKSKRVRTVPAALVTDYQCGTAILSRAWEGLMGGDSRYQPFVLNLKYNKLQTLMTESWVIDMCGLSVSSKDVLDIAERNRLLPARVLDILIALVRATFGKHSSANPEIAPQFLDSKFASMFYRNYTKFKKSKDKEAFVFTKGTIDSFKNQIQNATAGRFYIPYHLLRQHWIGVCIDCISCKVYVLDCNPAFMTDMLLASEMKHICEMFPWLLKANGCQNELSFPLSVERVKGVPSNTNPGDAGIAVALLIQAHALFGPETCQYITPSVIPEEATRAAVMIYEHHQIL